MSVVVFEIDKTSAKTLIVDRRSLLKSASLDIFISFRRYLKIFFQ